MAKSRISDQWLDQLEIPAAERDATRQCMIKGLKRYREEREDSLFKDEVLLQRAFSLGYAAVACVREPGLASETRLRLAAHTIQKIDLASRHGVPHGLPVLLSFMAQAGVLKVSLFRAVMVILDWDWPSLYDDWRMEEAHALMNWVITGPEMKDDEREWWLWYFLAHCEGTARGKSMFNYCIHHSDWSTESKRRLCRLFLKENYNIPPSPPQWRALRAMMIGDFETVQACLAEMEPAEAEAFSGLYPGQGIDEAGAPAEMEPETSPPPGLDVDYDEDIDWETDESEFPFGAAGVASGFMRKLLGEASFFLIPSQIQRLSVEALAALGEDPVMVCEVYISDDNAYYTPSVNGGVGAVLRTYHDRMPEAKVRELVERGVTLSLSGSRRVFFEVGYELFGEEYLHRALQDPAPTIQKWAAGVLKKLSTDR